MFYCVLCTNLQYKGFHAFNKQYQFLFLTFELEGNAHSTKGNA